MGLLLVCVSQEIFGGVLKGFRHFCGSWGLFESLIGYWRLCKGVPAWLEVLTPCSHYILLGILWGII